METMWYYVKDGTDREGPVPESELKSLAATGQIQPTDLVWSEGMTDWMPYAGAPALSGQPQPAAAPAASPLAASPMAASPMYGGGPAAAAPVQAGYPVPAGLSGWLMFVGVMHIIGGVLSCLAGLFAFIAVFAKGPSMAFAALFYIITGLLYFFAGTACTGARSALQSPIQIDAGTELFMSKIKRYMAIYGSMMIFFLVLSIVMLVVLLIAGLSFLQMMQ